MHQRINITLPADTVRLLDRVAAKRERSRFIDAAIREHAKRTAKARLRNQLKEGYLRENQIHRQVAEEWFPLEEETAQATTQSRY